jgi:predicted phage gp36 major capsid-like protein
MPRTKNFAGASSAFQQVRRQAHALLVELRREIRAKEAELRRLRDEESSLGRLTGSAGGSARNGAAERGGARTRIDWSAILEQLPKQFKAADVRALREIKDKRPSEVFAAITRWIEAGTVKRKSRGLYERA